MCKYQSGYFDFYDKQLKTYTCPHSPLSSGYCIFHDPDHWKTNEGEVIDEFFKLVEDAIENDKPLYCIGFNLPSLSINFFAEKMKIDRIEFKKPVYFNVAKFQKADFSLATFQSASFSLATFQKADFGATFQQNARFSGADFKGEVEFKNTKFALSNNKDTNNIPIRFDYATFRKRVRFIGEADEPLSLEFVSFKGVDLENVEFHNVKWREKREFLTKRKIIIDEEFMDKNKNYEEVSRIYNQLRKNYESKLLFNEASNFFIGEMEAIRKKLANDNKMRSIPYLFYKWIAMYGESASLPLLVWTPITILGFLALRVLMNCNSIDEECILMQATDGVRSYFLIPKVR